MSINLIKVFIV
jgi:hypothetical protein